MDYTLKKIAELAQVNVSSARFYRDKFEEYFTSTGEGRNRRYNESNISLLKTISKMYSEGMQAAQIIESLDQSYGIPTLGNLPTVAESATVQLDIINEIKLAFREEITRLEDKIDSLAQGSEDRDRLLMENIRLLQAKKKWKWWK